MGSVPTFTRLHLKCRSVEPVLGSRGMHSPRTTTGTRRRRRPRMTYSGGVCGMDHRRVGDHASGDVVGSPPPPTTAAVQSRQQHRTRVIALPSYVLYKKKKYTYTIPYEYTTFTCARRRPALFTYVLWPRCCSTLPFSRQHPYRARHAASASSAPNWRTKLVTTKYQVLQSI